jgi:hypothetical protein
MCIHVGVCKYVRQNELTGWFRVTHKAAVLGIEQDVQASRNIGSKNPTTMVASNDRRLLYHRHRQQDLSGLGYAVMD